jgi:predicted amidophosphoribosyltransferase
MKCPICGTNAQFDFLYCPHCRYKMPLAAEQALPNWRQMPGFRSKTPWKMLVSVIIYIWIIFAIVASLFSGV